MPKFVHICADEKFINSAYLQFEELYPTENKFYIYGTENNETKHIKLTNNFEFFDLNESFFKKIDKAIVVFHSLPDVLLPFLKFINDTNKIVWLLFGFETYGDPLLYNENRLLDKLTFKQFKNKSLNNSLKEKMKYLLYPILRKFKKDIYITKIEYQNIKRNQKVEALKRVDFFGFVYKEEYDFQCELLNSNRPIFNFCYYPLEKIVDVNQPIVLDKNTIMIGHSGFSNVNHLDVINKIKNYELNDSKILIPFSYGNQKYMKEVKSAFISYRNDITYLEDFLNLDSYNKVLHNVKIAIFNNRRQQAIGNIIALLYFGAKVFLSEENSFYHFLKRNKMIVFSYENELNNNTINTGLTLEEIKRNRKILYSLFNAEKLKIELQKSINIVLQND